MSLIRLNLGRSAVSGVVLAALILTLAGVALLLPGARSFHPGSHFGSAAVLASPQTVPALAAQKGAALAQFSASPLGFEPNQGQTDARVRYLARGAGYGLFLTSDAAVLSLAPASRNTDGAVVRMQLVGASPGLVSAEQELPARSHYLIGNQPSAWHRNVPQFARVRYQQVYPGVDLVYYGKQGSLEYDFVVQPGADPGRVRLQFAGATHVALDGDGNIRLRTAARGLKLKRPQIYQMVNGSRKPVDGRFLLQPDRSIGFRVANYDPRRELVIDPVLTYSTYLGGTGDELAPSIALDSGFNFYVAGTTTSTDFPTTTGVLQTSSNGGAEAFIAKFSLGGTLLYATYLGGTGDDAPAGIAVDGSFNVFVAGTTTSGDFPVTTNAFQTAPASGGTSHVFVSKLDAAGATLLYSTYLRGSASDTATGLAIDSSGNAYVTGTTLSTDFAGVAKPTGRGTSQFFVSKLNSLQTTPAATFVYATYIGGTTPAGAQTTGGGIAVDTSFNAFITGTTNYTDMPVVNAFQATLKGGLDAFVAKVVPDATSLAYCTYLGGTGDEIGTGIALDSSGNAYVVGSTTSADFPAITGTNPVTAFQPAHASDSGKTDAFIVKINNPTSASVALTYSSFLGGDGADTAFAVAADTNQNAYLAGETSSSNLAVTTSVPQSTLNGTKDAFAAKVSTTTSGAAGLSYLTYLGGSGSDSGTGIAVDPSANAFITGRTTSGDFPPAGTQFQASLKGASDAFVARLDGSADLQLTVIPTPTPIAIGSQVTYKYSVTNLGPDSASGVVLTSFLPSAGATFVSATASGGSCAPPTAGSVTCALGNIAVTGTGTAPTVSIVLAPTQPGGVPSSAVVNSTGTSDPSAGNNTASSSVPVEDFLIGIDGPTSKTVTAGAAVPFTVKVTPLNGQFSSSTNLSCSKFVPSVTGQPTCTFPTGSNPVPKITNSSPVSVVMTVNTVARPTTASLHSTSPWLYALWLPFAGVVVAGSTRRRRSMMVVLLACLLTLVVFQAACGNKAAAPATTGTPAGTYTITAQGAAGSVNRTADFTLVVQ